MRVNAVGLLFIGAFFSFQFVVVLYLQELRGWSTLETSLTLVIMAIDGILAPTLTPRLVTRFGHAPVLAAGVGAQLLAFALFLPMTADWSYFAMLPSLVAMGFAFTLAYGTLAIGATDGVEEAEHGLAGGLLYTPSRSAARSASRWSPPSSSQSRTVRRTRWRTIGPRSWCRSAQRWSQSSSAWSTPWSGDRSRLARPRDPREGVTIRSPVTSRGRRAHRG